ncbi:Tfp pilus assembly protein FimT/FimU [Alienimonas sp. DA493]|uniref:pilus assembly FimT family protein n=1 Tax=Alienimonas sp. DA493 TaxID=3373605 RepID=UPI0037545055
MQAFTRAFAAANRPRRGRAGYTLIELLIVIAIVLILAAVTITAVQAFRSGDVVSGSARQVQSYVSGARDRAIYTNRTDEGPRARGVRFLLDYNLTADLDGDPATDPTPFACTAMQYVESAGFYPPAASGVGEYPVGLRLYLAGSEGGSADPTQVLPPKNLSDLSAPEARVPFGDVNNDRFVSSAEQGAIDADDLRDAWAATPLWSLFRSGLLGEPIVENDGQVQYFNAKIRLPKFAAWGRWYAAVIESASKGLEQDARLSGIQRIYLMTEPEFTGGLPRYNEKSAEFGWVFQLRTVPLAGEQPRALPAGTAIDLYSAATLGGLPDSWLIDGVPAGHLDLMFDPSGLVTGPLAASGTIHLPVVGLEDLDRGSNQYDAGEDPPGYRPGTFLPLGYVGTNPDVPAAYDPATKVYAGPGKTEEELVVSVNTQTGNITVAPVDPFDGNADGLADDPLYFAETGTEAP